MAKRGRPAKAQTNLGEQVERSINPNVLVQLVKTKGENKSKIGEINGDLGAQLKHHAELSGLNKAAFGFICKLNSMKTEDRERALRDVKLYADIMVEKHVWEAHVGDLAEQAAAAQANEGERGPSDDEQEDDPRPEFMKENERQRMEADAAETEQVSNNVTQLQRGIKPIAATA